MKQAPINTGQPPPTPTPDEQAWLTQEARSVAQALVAIRDEDEMLRFLRDLCTVTELREFGERWQVAQMLDAGMSYAEIQQQTGASSATISRVGQWLRYGRGGYRLAIDRLATGEQAR